MQTHEPRDEFVERLEWQIGREVQRRNRLAGTARWIGLPRARSVLAVGGLMLASMAIGAAVAARAYEAEDASRSQRLAAGFERRAELARQHLASAAEELKAVERRVALGTAGQEELLTRRVEVVEAEVQVASLRLQLDEVRITGREPLGDVSAPLVSGRDFVGERWRVEMSASEAALELERFGVRDAEKRLAVGVADALDVEAARVRVVELEAAVQALQSRIAIRRQFLDGHVDADESELRVIEANAVQRQKALALKLALARRQSERATSRLQTGVGERIDVAEAALRLRVLEAEMARVELDLTVVRQQIERRRAKR